ncbi:hypothetical protein [Mucilaginibacter sp.]
MTAYQEKWIEILTNANVPDWKITAEGSDIHITLPAAHNVSTVMENLPDVLATLALDINLSKERLKFILQNGKELHEYVINPADADLNTARH